MQNQPQICLNENFVNKIIKIKKNYILDLFNFVFLIIFIKKDNLFYI